MAAELFIDRAVSRKAAVDSAEGGEEGGGGRRREGEEKGKREGAGGGVHCVGHKAGSCCAPLERRRGLCPRQRGAGRGGY